MDQQLLVPVYQTATYPAPTEEDPTVEEVEYWEVARVRPNKPHHVATIIAHPRGVPHSDAHGAGLPYNVYLEEQGLLLEGASEEIPLAGDLEEAIMLAQIDAQDTYTCTESAVGQAFPQKG